MRRNTALAIVSASAAPDPIFAAIDRFNDAADAYWTAHIAAEERGLRVWSTHPAVARVAEAWLEARNALSRTRATTMAGVLALAELIASDCERIECDIGECCEAIPLVGNLRNSIAALARALKQPASREISHGQL